MNTVMLRRSCADVRRAERMLGFKPKIMLEQGLKELFKPTKLR